MSTIEDILGMIATEAMEAGWEAEDEQRRLKMDVMTLTCTWCEEHPLTVRRTATGFYIGCSEVQSTNCPNATGEFPTKEEAIQSAVKYVAELNVRDSNSIG